MLDLAAFLYKKLKNVCFYFVPFLYLWGVCTSTRFLCPLTEMMTHIDTHRHT